MCIRDSSTSLCERTENSVQSGSSSGAGATVKYSVVRWVRSALGMTAWHSCGAVDPIIPLFIEAGFDALNPVQCSACLLYTSRCV